MMLPNSFEKGINAMPKTEDPKVSTILRDLKALLDEVERGMPKKINSFAEASIFAGNVLEIRRLLTELQQLRANDDLGQAIELVKLIRRCKDIEGLAKETRNDLLKASETKS